MIELDLPGPLLRDRLIATTKLASTARKRLDPNETKNVKPDELQAALDEGWEQVKQLKRSIKVQRPKRHDIAFEHRVWAMLAQLKFSFMNDGRDFEIRYGKQPNETKQIDVFAADDEVVLVVECKSSATIRRNDTFKTEVEAIQGYREGVIKAVRKEFPKHKVKFILATNNYALSDATTERIAAADIKHLDEEAVTYYLELAKHLGEAARYQLLGSLLAGQKIPGITNEIPAIRGRMGGVTYYLFAIEPELLLKLAYVLHRNKANSDLMPTYQRLIKRSRLRKVADFVDNGGFFPNSLILSIDSGGRKRGLRFDSAGGGSASAKMGILHLPAKYRSAFVIDGQHRLYGFADSDRATTELVPVVAFVDMDRAEQVQMFMDINENQKAVPKNLRNTLNADLLWESDDLRERNKALRLTIAQHLGENKSSPLFSRVIVGEDPATRLRCITIDAIANGLSRGRLLGSYTKLAVKDPGLLHAGTNAATLKVVLPIVEGAFQYLIDGLPDQWRLGGETGGFVFRNNGVEAYLRLLSDIIEQVKASGAADPRNDSSQDVVEACEPYLDAVIDFLESRTEEQATELRQLYGTGGAKTYWRNLQEAVAAKNDDFQPVGLEEFLEDREQQFNGEAREMIHAIEAHLKSEVQQRLRHEFGDRMMKDGIPRKVVIEATTMMTERNLERDTDDEVDFWDCLYLINYADILTYKNPTWTKLFAKDFTKPGTEQAAGGWKKRADWIRKLNDVRNKVSHGQTVSLEEHGYVTEVFEWLIDN